MLSDIFIIGSTVIFLLLFRIFLGFFYFEVFVERRLLGWKNIKAFKPHLYTKGVLNNQVVSQKGNSIQELTFIGCQRRRIVH